MTAELLQPDVNESIADFPDTLDFLFEPHRYKVLWGGRGGTKSWGVARALLIQATDRPLRILCTRETMKSVEESVHQLLRQQIDNLGLPGWTVEKKHIWNVNGSTISFDQLRHNVHTIKSIEAIDIVWIEEAANVSKASWDILIPSIRKDGSEIWLTFNPVLETDATYQRFVLNPPSNAFVRKVGWQDNPWFPGVLEIERLDLLARDPVAYQHVYEGHCKSTVEGAIFAGEIAQAELQGRIGNVPYDRSRPVDTVWDLGFTDRTAIWFVQAYGGYYNLIDYLEDEGRTIEWYLVQCQQKGYMYGIDWVPHDGADALTHAKLTSHTDMSPEQLMRAAGRNVRIVQKLKVISRINAARTIFNRCRFDRDKCEQGLRALRMYQWGPLTDKGIEPRKPLHDQYSHGADAFTEVAIAVKEPRIAEPPKPRQLAPPPRQYTPFA